MRLFIAVLSVAICISACAQAPSDSSRVKLHTYIGSVQDAVQFQYDTKDDLNQSMDCAKIISNPEGGFIAVYHHMNEGQFNVFLATSLDFLTWTIQAVMANDAHQPCIYADESGGYFMAWEQNPNNHIKVAYYIDLNDLLMANASDSYDIPQTLSSCAEGTPNIYSVTNNVIDIGFHFYDNCLVDRQARGTLTDFNVWQAAPQLLLDNSLLYWGVEGNIGDRDYFQYDGYDFGLIEGQYIPGDFGSWNTFIYDYSTGNAEPLDIVTHSGSTAFANPTVTMMDMNGSRAMVVTLFMPSEGAAPGEAGELMYYTFIDDNTSECIVDLNSDGIVSVQDILLILSEFGCMTLCENDVNQDGFVTVDDVLSILSEFGNFCE